MKVVVIGTLASFHTKLFRDSIGIPLNCGHERTARLLASTRRLFDSGGGDAHNFLCRGRKTGLKRPRTDVPSTRPSCLLCVLPKCYPCFTSTNGGIQP